MFRLFTLNKADFPKFDIRKIIVSIGISRKTKAQKIKDYKTKFRYSKNKTERVEISSLNEMLWLENLIT